jgi:hypothetical protein
MGAALVRVMSLNYNFSLHYCMLFFFSINTNDKLLVVADNTSPDSKNLNFDYHHGVVVSKIKGGDLGLKIYLLTYFHLKTLSKCLKNLPKLANNPQ